MVEKKLRFAIFGNEFQSKKSSSINKILAVLKNFDAKVAIDRSFMDFLLAEHVKADGATVFDGDDFEADYVISMGGDGTLLKAAARVGEREIPIVGINMGRLGFLSNTQPSNIEGMVKSIYDGTAEISRHSVIEVQSVGDAIEESRFALNDIAVLKRDNASMISIHTSVSGNYLVTYQADGLIISTPTGSTAYGLSNGGPIMVPDTKTLALTPVAPHSLNIRPLVIPDNAVIEISVESRSHNFLIAIDGRSVTLSEETKLLIKKADHVVNIVSTPEQNYFSVLREKMMWGMDIR